MSNWKFRSGVWVETDAGVGIRLSETILVSADGSRKIVNASTTPGPGESIDREWWIHLTNPNGSTLAQIPERSAGAISIARGSSIPASRVEHLDAQALAKLGYE